MWLNLIGICGGQTFSPTFCHHTNTCAQLTNAKTKINKKI
jgi:hypothetical protein